MRTFSGFPDEQSEMDRALSGENHSGRPSAEAIRRVLSLPATRGGKPAVAEPGPLTAKLLAEEQGCRLKRRKGKEAA